MRRTPAMERFGLPSDDGGKDLGVFMPIANGGWILSRNAPPIDGSYAYNREVARLADDLGIDFLMLMARYRGFGGDIEHWRHTLDATVTMAALAEAMRHARRMATLDQISGGRAGLNLVTGSYRDEFAQMGTWPEGVDHDERYDPATEWIGAIQALWSEERVTRAGRRFTFDDCMSDPKPATDRCCSARSTPRPMVRGGG